MVIKKAEFIESLASAADMPEDAGKVQIAVVGKSNVGKSSLINALARNQKLARTSSEPGKTRLINLFGFFTQEGGEFVLVDLPGYGFALVDIRHEPSDDDRAMVDYLRHFGIEFTVVATKADKLSRAQAGRSVQAICRALQVQPWEVMPVSAQSRQGLDALLERLDGVVGAGEAEP